MGLVQQIPRPAAFTSVNLPGAISPRLAAEPEQVRVGDKPLLMSHITRRELRKVVRADGQEQEMDSNGGERHCVRALLNLASYVKLIEDGSSYSAGQDSGRSQPDVAIEIAGEADRSYATHDCCECGHYREMVT
jgi:hypothetical protein